MWIHAVVSACFIYVWHCLAPQDIRRSFWSAWQSGILDFDSFAEVNSEKTMSRARQLYGRVVYSLITLGIYNRENPQREDAIRCLDSLRSSGGLPWVHWKQRHNADINGFSSLDYFFQVFFHSRLSENPNINSNSISDFRFSYMKCPEQMSNCHVGSCA